MVRRTLLLLSLSALAFSAAAAGRQHVVRPGTRYPQCSMVTGTGGVTFTLDQGTTLAPIAVPADPITYTYGLTVMVDEPDTLMAWHEDDLLLSTDGGCSWRIAATVPGADFPPKLEAAKGGRVYAWSENRFFLVRWDARGVQVLPGNDCTPTVIAERARDIAKRHGMDVTILDRAAIVKEGLTALLAVAQGSDEEPRFIAIEYRGAEGAPVVLVGKGITFDSGGISIKPAQSMEEMKYDMSGAAAVLGTFEMLGRLKPAVHVVGLIPSAENMLSGTAYKPGDVVRSHFGKTIEVVNTDAEGRLILADALSWARRYQPACVIDAATLTGAMVIALGHTATGVMGTDERLIDEIRQAGERAGERVWPLPLWDEYHDLIKSDIADMKNSGGRPAGSISAAWFLREFVDGFPWAHLDIAGTAYSDRDDPTRVKGPTGVGVRLFSEFVLARAR
jgi:leucyl aminopeptidase